MGFLSPESGELSTYVRTVSSPLANQHVRQQPYTTRLPPIQTSHLLNLRYLEQEIAELDHIIYQAGLALDLHPSSEDRLGLRHGKRDQAAPELDETAERQLILKLRHLLAQYGPCFLYDRILL